MNVIQSLVFKSDRHSFSSIICGSAYNSGSQRGKWSRLGVGISRHLVIRFDYDSEGSDAIIK